jgi:hypothetical protein
MSDTTICQGDKVKLRGVLNSNLIYYNFGWVWNIDQQTDRFNSVYIWPDISGNNYDMQFFYVQPQVSRYYKITIKYNEKIVIEDSIHINVLQKPIFNVTQSQTKFSDTLKLNITPLGGQLFLENNKINNNIITSHLQGQYQLKYIYTNELGCQYDTSFFINILTYKNGKPNVTNIIDSRYIDIQLPHIKAEEKGILVNDTATIKLKATCFIPNAFNPNSLIDDNKTFRIFGQNIKETEIHIYSRNGQLLYHGNNQWTGDNYPNGDYIYEIIITFIDNNKKYKKGIVTLLK